MQTPPKYHGRNLVTSVYNFILILGSAENTFAANAQGNYGTFLRGASTTAASGIAEFQTIFPGYTSEGANHINLLVHTSSSATSAVAHTGRVFFTDKWTTIIEMQPPYNTNTHERTTNLDDPVYAAAGKAGFYPVVE